MSDTTASILGTNLDALAAAAAHHRSNGDISVYEPPDGWVAAVPTTALILSLQWLEPDLGWAKVEFWRAWTGASSLMHRAAAPAGPLPYRGRVSWREVLFNELLDERIDEDALWAWQLNLLDDICDAQSLEGDLDQWEWVCLQDRVLASTEYALGYRIHWKELFFFDGTSSGLEVSRPLELHRWRVDDHGQ